MSQPAAGFEVVHLRSEISSEGKAGSWRIIVVALVALFVANCGGPTANESARSPDFEPPQTAVSTTTTSTTIQQVSPIAALGSLLDGRSGEVTVAVLDGTTGRVWTYNPGLIQDTASIVKVEIMGTALQEAQNAGGPLPEAESALMPSMIENSDNDSATSLLSDVGGASALARFDRSAGLTQTTPSSLPLIPGTSLPGWGLTTTSALDEVTLVSRFAYPNGILSTSSREYGLNLMEQVETDQDWGISAGVPAGATVALKNGWLPLGPNDWQVNSIGWVSGAGHSYVLAVLTTGSPTEADGIDTIEAVSTYVFDHLG